MAPGTDAAACLGKSESGFCKDHDEDSKKARDDSDDSVQAKPSRPPLLRHCSSHVTLVDPFSLICSNEGGLKPDKDSGFQPTFRSGSCSEIGPKQYMEDEFICVDDLPQHLGTANAFPSPGAFYGVFDGHGGKDAASFTRKNLLKFITEDSHFPDGVKRALKNAFVKADHALADSQSLDKSSGTTALVALMLGRTMIIANAGDSRAVLGKRGRAIELSKDHKPNCTSERLRIEKLGGVIYDGYLNGQLSVARALGDWHMKGAKGLRWLLAGPTGPNRDPEVASEEEHLCRRAGYLEGCLEPGMRTRDACAEGSRRSCFG